MTDALALLKRFRDEVGCAPHDDRGQWPPSNAQLRRWLSSGGVEINKARPGPEDSVDLPLSSLVFFPGGKRQTTVI